MAAKKAKKLSVHHPFVRGREITIRIPKGAFERVMTISIRKGVKFSEAAEEMFRRGYLLVRKEMREKGLDV